MDTPEVVEAATEAETAEAARMTVGDRLCSTKADVVVVVPLAWLLFDLLLLHSITFLWKFVHNDYFLETLVRGK